MKTIRAIKIVKCLLPLKISSPSKATPISLLIFVGMAKGLRLVIEAIKFGCQQCDLVLDSCKVVGVLSLYISYTINPLKNDLKSIWRH